MTRMIVADGYWCADCEFFEQELDLNDGRCMACGCGDDRHEAVEVVTTQ